MIRFPIGSVLLLFLASSLQQPLCASNYEIDTKGGHAYIEFKISHLGFSWLSGRFNRFSGETRIVLADFGITKYLGASAKRVALSFGIEGIRKKSKNRPRRPGGLPIR